MANIYVSFAKIIKSEDYDELNCRNPWIAIDFYEKTDGPASHCISLTS